MKGPVILIIEGIQNLRLDGLLTLIAITHGNLGGLMKLTRYPEQMIENVKKFDVKKATDSWNKIRDLRHTLIQYLLQQNCFGTGEDETIEREEDVRRHVGGIPLLTDLSLAMRTDPLALIRGATEFVTVIYGPAVTFAFPDVKGEAYRRSVLHLNLISAVDGSALNWCEEPVLRELMSEDLLFAKISEPEMTVINFDDHFRDRMGEVERGHIEVFPKLWNLKPYDKTNGEITRVPRLTAAYHKVREETKDWRDYEKLPVNPEPGAFMLANNQLKYNFTGVPEADPRACFNRATWNTAVSLQQPPLGTSHLILGDSLVRVLSNLRTSWITTVMAFGGATITQLFRMVELMNPGRTPNVTILVGTNNISRSSDEEEALWESMMVCLFTTPQKFNCAVLTVCTVPMNTRTLTAAGKRHR